MNMFTVMKSFFQSEKHYALCRPTFRATKQKIKHFV